MTTGGSLRVKIVNDGGQKVYFNKKDPEGDYEISVDEAGTCYMEIYAENHKTDSYAQTYQTYPRNCASNRNTITSKYVRNTCTYDSL